LFEAGLIRICLDVSPSASVAAYVSCWPILVAEQVLLRQREIWSQHVLDPTEQNGKYPDPLIRIGCIYLGRWDVEEVQKACTVSVYRRRCFPLHVGNQFSWDADFRRRQPQHHLTSNLIQSYYY